MIVKRDYYLRQLITGQHNRLIKVVTGIRRSGKLLQTVSADGSPIRIDVSALADGVYFVRPSPKRVWPTSLSSRGEGRESRLPIKEVKASLAICPPKRGIFN